MPRIDYMAIDNYASTIEGTSVQVLTEQLCKPYEREAEKVRSIFSWIAFHISYYTKRPAYAQRPLQSMWGTVSQGSGEEDIAAEVLRTRTAVCNGYARLFQTMCNYAGIQSAVITGYAAGNVGRFPGKFATNHYWNAVFTDSAWHLLDVTWASGYMSYNGENFIANFNPEYFYTDPEDFARDHFPDDLTWTLGDHFRMPFEFERSPFQQRSFIKYHFTQFFPTKGVIEVAPGDTLSFTLNTNDAIADRRIFPDTIRLDSAMQSIKNVFLFPLDTAALANVQYKYIVGENMPAFIHLVYQNDVVLRYRLKLRRNWEMRETQ